MQWNQRIKLEETEGVFIPGFNGLAAPYWKNGFEDIRIDLSERPNEIIRAAMESIGFLVNDILNCIKTAGLDLPETLTASGLVQKVVFYSLLQILQVKQLVIHWLKIKQLLEYIGF